MISKRIELNGDYAGLKNGMRFTVIDRSVDAFQIKSGLWIPLPYCWVIEG